MGKGSGPIEAFKQVTEGGGGELGREWSKRRNGPFQRPLEEVMFLFRACFHSLKL
jgi:hypothetical protein